MTAPIACILVFLTAKRRSRETPYRTVLNLISQANEQNQRTNHFDGVQSSD